MLSPKQHAVTAASDAHTHGLGTRDPAQRLPCGVAVLVYHRKTEFKGPLAHGLADSRAKLRFGPNSWGSRTVLSATGWLQDETDAVLKCRMCCLYYLLSL